MTRLLCILSAVAAVATATAPAPLPSSGVRPPSAAAAVPPTDAPALTLPSEVTGDAGEFITVAADTNGTVVRWHVIDPGLNLFPVDLLRDTRTAVVTSPREGRYRLLGYTAVGDVPSAPSVVTVIVGDEPEPTPPRPDPDDDDVDPEPDDGPPFPADSLHVLIVYESADVNQLTDDQRAIIMGADVRGALDSAAPDRYRIYDQDADLTYVDQVWKDAMAVPRESLPWLVISDGETGYSGPLDMTAAEFRELIGGGK